MNLIVFGAPFADRAPFFYVQLSHSKVYTEQPVINAPPPQKLTMKL